MKITKVLISCDDSHYQYFWPVVAQVCKKVLNITPVLFKLGENESPFFSDGNGIVKYVKKLDNFSCSLQGQLLRLYGTKYFLDEVCLISDIDMMLLNRKYFIDQIEKFSDESYIIFSSDGYDPKRDECKSLFEFEVYPMCYHAAKGKVFTEILEIEDDFQSFLSKVMNLQIDDEKKWFRDEIYLSSKINEKQNKFDFHRLKRGYQNNFYLEDRIEKYNFPVDYSTNEEMRQTNLRLGNYDPVKLKNLFYIDCHCVRPYGFYDKEIWQVANLVMKNYSEKPKDLILITAHCDTEAKENILRNLVNQINKESYYFDILVVSHTILPQDIVEKCNLHLFDKKNELLYDYNMRSKPWFAPNGGKPILSIFTGFFNTHLAVWRMIILGNSLAKNCGYRKVHHIEYDCSIKNFNELYNNSELLDHKDSITYNKKVKDVDDILFGTYQAYRLDSLHEDLFLLNEEKIKNEILNSNTKSPEGMLFHLLHNKRNGLIKDKSELDKNGNEFGLSHGDINKNHVAWCLPYFDKSTEKLCFIVWNMEERENLSVQVIYNDEKVFNFSNVQPRFWNILEIDNFDNAKKLVVILNNKIRNIFDFTENRESFKQNSYRE